MKALSFSALILWGTMVSCTSTSAPGHVDVDPFEPRDQNPIFTDFDEAWIDPEPQGREPAFFLAERVLIPSQEIVSLDFRGAPLANAIHLIAEIAGVNIYLDSKHSNLIDASFPNVRIDEALEVVLLRNGLALEELAGNVYSVRESNGATPTTARFKLLSSHADDVASKLAEILGDQASVVADSALNVVLVQGTRSIAERAAEIVETIDHRPPQVLIEVGIYEASIDDGFELGVSHTFSDLVDNSSLDILQAFTTPDTQFSLTLENSQGTLESTIQALRRHVGVELISSPRVMTATNTKALVEIIEEVPYVKVTATNTTGAGAGSSSNVQEEVEFKQAGITMDVLPVIQADGLVEITIDQTVSDVVDFFNSIPVIDRQHISTTFLVADGQTAVMGGLMQDRRRTVDEGVPVLGKIPVIGRLFRKDVDATEKRELLVFVTPRILDPLQAAQVARKYKQAYREQREQFELPMLAQESTTTGQAAGTK